MNSYQAVQQLRLAAGLSQQAFASQLGMSVRAIANYEKDRAPSKPARLKLAKCAYELKRPDLAKVLAAPLEMQVHFDEPAIGDKEHSALVALTLNRGSDWLRKTLSRELSLLLKDARTSPELLFYPEISHTDKKPAIDERALYLESLLKDLQASSQKHVKKVADGK